MPLFPSRWYFGASCSLREISLFHVWNLLFCSCKTEIGRKPMLLSPSGSGVLVEAKLDLAGDLVEQAPASMFDLLFWSLQNRNRTKAYAFISSGSGDLLFLCLQKRNRTKAYGFISLWIRCFGGSQA